MNGTQIADLQEHYDNTDVSAALDGAKLDVTTIDDPMVGITIRLPASTLNAAREVAAARDMKVTALLREWVEHQLADQVDETRTVAVSELRRLIAQARTR